MTGSRFRGSRFQGSAEGSRCRTAAARCPLTTAPSIVAGSPVSVQSPARTSPASGVSEEGRGGSPGASENVARFSRTALARRTVAAAAAGSAALSSRVARSISASFDCATTSSAPLETSDRCDHALPARRDLSKTHWNVRRGSPTNAVRVTGRSSHRLTVTIGEGLIAAACSAIGLSAATPSANAGNANQGTADTTAPARMRSPCTSTPTARSPSDNRRADWPAWN